MVRLDGNAISDGAVDIAEALKVNVGLKVLRQV